MSPLLVPTGFLVDQQDVPNGVTLIEWARVRHALRRRPNRTIRQVADAACVSEAIATLCLMGKGATIEEA